VPDNEFRISGGLGGEEPASPYQNYLTQGIGFPLRPVDNVTNTNSPDLSGIIAKGIFMSWMGNWEQGLIYPKGSQVRDGSFIMLANKDTFERAAPQSEGDPSFSQPSYSPEATDPSNVSTIISGHVYTFTDEGWIKQLRVWVPALSSGTIGYRILVVDVPVVGEPTTTVVTPILGAVDEWVTVALLNNGVAVGDAISVTLEALNSGASTDIDGGWNYQGPTQTGAPQAQSWTVDNQRTSFRINKFDLDGTDRGTELEGVIPESTILVVDTDITALTGSYRVVTVIDQGLYMEYGVVLVNEAGGGPQIGVTNVEIDVPIPLATEYAEELAVWPAGNPAWATVESVLLYGETDQNVTTSGFGVDIEFQPASVSDDWDIIVSE